MAFPIHHVMQTEEEVEPLDQIDQAASDRILELFATPYPELTRAQVLILERIVAATKVAQLPYSHVFQPDNVLYDDTMDIDDDISLATIIIPRCEPLADLAPYICSTKGQHSTGHTTPNSVVNQMRGMWNMYFENARGYDEGHVYDVLEFVEYIELFMDDPAVGMPLNTWRGGECHFLYDHERQFFILQSNSQSLFLLCMTPGCFRMEGKHISFEFPHCFRHYNTEVHVVLEITRVHDNDDNEEETENHPYRHVQFQLSVDGDWSNAKTKKYLQKVWFQHKQAYPPNVPSVVTEAWIFTTYQAAVDKISCLEFCHILKSLNDTTYEYVSDQTVLPVNLHDQLEPLLHSLGITITLQGSVSDEDLESIGLSDLFGVPFNEESLKESKIVLYRESNNHFEYRGVTTDWSKKQLSDKGAGKSLLYAAKERGHKFTFEPRRILYDRTNMLKAESMTILGSVIVSYLHAPRPDTRHDFVNVNCRVYTTFSVNRSRISDMQNVPLQTYENPEEHDEDYSYDDEAAFYDGQYLTDLELLMQWIAHEYRIKVIITVNPEEVEDQ
ncbi:uncharacterized protein LOC110843685 [Folsomia candida]|uniref:Uncharacterized protein n=1 Tax=Folsomia candida TaxID=158441 RepID=A0A226ER35_FOLCA|nr:uncharacterized protein LOC110843685 [Folsomia candida]OXA59056.1 hypothetical protein Fcan01_04109 [Folsomia candida]